MARRGWIRRLRTGLRIAIMLALATGIWLGIWHVLADRQDRQAVWQGIVLPTAILLLLVIVAIRHELYWTRPIRHLRETLDAVRSGQLAIDELSSVGGGASRLVPDLQSLLRELRQQKQENRLLAEEMRQRIAGRTDALERRLGSLKELATRDALTGLRNRRALEDEYPRVFEACKVAGRDLCVVMIDVDHFKPLNDTLGHARGDELLRSIGQLIRSTIRDGDLAYRYGGDEFVLVLPGGSSAAGASLAERLESLVDALVKPLRLALSPRLCHGISSVLETAATTAQDLLDASDKRLYERKASRKNDLRCVMPAA